MDGFACWGTSTPQMTYHVLFIQHTETVQTYTVQMELTESRVWVRSLVKILAPIWPCVLNSVSQA